MQSNLLPLPPIKTFTTLKWNAYLIYILDFFLLSKKVLQEVMTYFTMILTFSSNGFQEKNLSDGRANQVAFDAYFLNDR